MGFSNVFPFKWCFFREFHILSKTISLRNVWCWNEIEDEIVDWVNHGKTLGKTSSNMMKYGKNHWENHVKPCATLAKNIGKTMVKCCKLWQNWVNCHERSTQLELQGPGPWEGRGQRAAGRCGATAKTCETKREKLENVQNFCGNSVIFYDFLCFALILLNISKYGSLEMLETWTLKKSLLFCSMFF